MGVFIFLSITHKLYTLNYSKQN